VRDACLLLRPPFSDFCRLLHSGLKRLGRTFTLPGFSGTEGREHCMRTRQRLRSRLCGVKVCGRRCACYTRHRCCGAMRGGTPRRVFAYSLPFCALAPWNDALAATVSAFSVPRHRSVSSPYFFSHKVYMLVAAGVSCRTFRWRTPRGGQRLLPALPQLPLLALLVFIFSQPAWFPRQRRRRYPSLYCAFVLDLPCLLTRRYAPRICFPPAT